MIKKSLILFFILSFVFFAFKANAQVQSGDIVLKLSPQYPKANEQVTATISSFATNLDNARISWTLDGQSVLSGMGKKDYSFNAGNTGFQKNLSVKIETLDGSAINKQITILPSDVDMLWEAYDTYAPPFYEGKTLASAEGSVKVVAIPSTQNLAGFSYDWKEDDKGKPDSSGYEKNFYVYQNSYLENENVIGVAVSDILGNGIGDGQITIIPGTPKIVFYEKDPNLGTRWEKALSDGYVINKNGDTVVAEPYFFSIGDLNSLGYNFTWSLNGEPVVIPGQQNTLSIKPENNKSGQALIKVVINNAKTLFQTLDKEINVNF